MRKNALTIILITAFSIILWGFITLSKDYNYRIQSRVKFVELPDGFQVANSDYKEIELKLKGQGLELIGLAIGDIPEFEVSGKLAQGIQEKDLMDMIDNNSWIPNNVLIDEIIPSRIKFELEKIDTKKVRIVPEIFIEEGDGFKIVSEIKIEPDSVLISGAKSLLKNIENVRTEFIEFKAIDKEVDKRLKIITADGIISETKFCRIKFDVQQVADKIFENIQVDILGAPDNRTVQLFPGRINVVLRGGIKKLSNMDPSGIKAFINYRQAVNDTTGTLVPRIEVPVYTEFIKTIPENLEYIIKRY